MNELDSNDWFRNASDQVFRAVGTAAKKDLQQDSYGTQISQLVQKAQLLTDSIIRDTVEYGPINHHPVCAEGCNACCHLHVVAHPMEVIAVAEHLHRTTTREELGEIQQRINQHIDQTNGQNAEARRSIRPACPLLKDGRCEIYSVRPIACRGWNSLDRNICDADLADPSLKAATPVNLGQYVMAGRVAEGLAAASFSLSLESHAIDFVRGLRIALEDPELSARLWRGRGDVFSAAVNDTVFPGSQNVEEEDARLSLWNSL